jgi:hypothetical protein
MRPALSVTLCLVAIAACVDNTKIVPSMVQWMDWPAEVNAGESFRTRIVVWGVCASNPRFRPGVNADQSAVTFAPYFIIDDDNVVCAAARVESVVISAIDTAGIAPGLLAFRTYEMRGSWHGYIRGPAGGALLPNLPVRTFGEVGVRPSGADPARRNAAGYIRVDRDSLGCVRVAPSGIYNPQLAYVLEDQADTVGLSFAFARGYIHEVAAPVCGETRVFHLVSVED